MKTLTLLEVAQKNPSRDRIISRGLQTREELSFTYSTDDDAIEEIPAVDRFGGSRGFGVIRQASLIAGGEALGHDQWIDGDALDQVVELGNEKSSGLKVRFTHPSMSGDGLGSYLGRARSLVRDGDKVFGDVHFSPSSRDTPDGDLGGYVMELAEDDPEAFGMSIVFDHDPGAEAAFVEGHSDDGGFLSPDDRNVRSLPHVRIGSLHAADFVDSPAANPTGLFHRGPTADILKQAENLFDFILGITDDEPEDSGGFSASRLRGFLGRFCDGRGIALKVVSTRKATQMSAETQEDEIIDQSVETETPESDPENEATGEETVVEEQVEEPVGSFSRSDVEKFATKFGAETGVKYLLDGTSFEDALSAEFDLLQVKGSIVGGGEGRGEDEPVGTFGGEGDEKSFSGGVLPKSVERFSSLISLPASRN